nr:glutathione S-transferase theta-1-like [Arachis hypogaea]
MLKVKVYADHMSQPSHAILIFCKVNGIEFDEIKVEISKRQQLSPKFAAINPFKKLPAIVNGRFKLFERYVNDHSVRYLVVTSASLKLNGKSSSFQDVWCGPGIGLASDHASASVDCVVARKNASSRRNLDAVERATHREETLHFHVHIIVVN